MWILLLFLFGMLEGEESPQVAHYEGSPSGIVAGVLNVISGDLCFSELDLVIPGADPIYLSRTPTYAPGLIPNDPCKGTWNFPFMERMERVQFQGKQSFKHFLGSQYFLNFQAKQKHRTASFIKENHPKGITNVAHGGPTGKTSLKNISIMKNPSEDRFVTLLLGSGERRNFFSSYRGGDSETHATIPIGEIKRPSGFIHWYDYDRKLTHGSVTVNSPRGAKASYYKYWEENNVLKIHAFDGRWVNYSFHKDLDAKLLRKVNSSDYPVVEYGYKKLFGIQKIAYTLRPDWRMMEFDYWELGNPWVDGPIETKLGKEAPQLGKVKCIRQPVGTTNERIPTYFVRYFWKGSKGPTAKSLPEYVSQQIEVSIPYGHVDHYRTDDSKNRLIEVLHCSNRSPAENFQIDQKMSTDLELNFRETFTWNEDGELLCSALYDSKENFLQYKTYTYDLKGNPTQESFNGYLTGNEASTKFSEKYTFNKTYSEDGFNLLTSESHPTGLEYKYSYKSGTDLLSEKQTFANNRKVKSESYQYNQDNCLIELIEEDEGARRVEKITPAERPFGYPRIKDIYAGPAGQETLLESYHYNYTARGQIDREERRDAEGSITSVIERTFNPYGHCIEEVNALGHRTLREFDQNGNCLKEVGPRPGLIKEFTYDFMNRCTEEKLSFEGQVWTLSHAYNRLNQRVKTTDELGQITETVYDRYGNPLETHLPEISHQGKLIRPVIRKTFDVFGNVTKSTDPMGYATEKEYTSRNQPFEIIHPDGSKETNRYSLSGLLISTIDQDGLETTYTYDPLGRLLSKETPFGTETFTYNGSLLVQSVDLLGVATTYSYDIFGRLVETKIGDRKEVISYDNLGHPFRKAHYEGDKLLSTEVSKVDALGQIIESFVEDPSGEIYHHQRFFYDEAGNCVEEWLGASKTTRSFDGKNRITEVTNSLGHTHRVIYSPIQNSFGQTVLEKRVIDPNGEQTLTLYDTHGREETILNLNPSSEEIRRHTISYDLAGHVIKEETFGNGEQRTLLKEVDAMGRVITLIEPLGKVTRYTYTPAGQLAVLTKPDGIKLFHIYEKGRLSSLESSDGKISYSYLYNRKGELIEVLDKANGTTSLQTFSIYGDLLQETLANGQTLSYAYDVLGRMISYSLPDGGTAELTYNSVAATSVIRKNSAAKILYTHNYTSFDAIGNVLEQQLIGDAGTVSTSYNLLYQLTSIYHPKWKEKDLTYDPAGNLLSYTQQEETFTFSYDDLYQLITEKDHRYTFDPFYNRRSKDNSSYQINELNELLSEEDASYSYDPNGNLIKKGEILLAYDPLDRLITIQKGNERVIFTYDAFNRRLTRNNEPFYFCRENEIGHQNSLRILGRGLGGDIGAAISIELDGIPYAPLHDHNGSIIALLNLHGPLLSSWQLTAYGELLGTSPSPWTFSSKRTEPLTNWLSFPHRDYAPETGRWTTPDPLGYPAGPNLYTYVSNNPLTHLDPLGLFEFSFSLGGPSFLPPLVSAPTVFMDPMSAANSLNGPRIDGAMRTIYGFSEMSGGASAMSTGIGLVPGGILFSHGLDNAQSGLHQMFLGEYVTPLTSQLFQAAGINESDANFGNDLLTLSSAVKSAFTSVIQIGKNLRFSSLLCSRPSKFQIRDVIHVTPDGVALPSGSNYRIPSHYVENVNRTGSYGEIVNGKFIEKLRIDPPTPPGAKGPNFSHYHLNGKSKHYGPREEALNPGFNP